MEQMSTDESQISNEKEETIVTVDEEASETHHHAPHQHDDSSSPHKKTNGSFAQKLRHLSKTRYFYMVLCVLLPTVVALIVTLTVLLPVSQEENVVKSPTTTALTTALYPQDFSLTLTRTRCYGTCPSYTVSVVAANATVAWEGRHYVRVLGRETESITEQAVEALYDAFQQDFFWSLREDYGVNDVTPCDMHYTDMPTATTTVIMNGNTKQVQHYYGCFFQESEQLAALETLIDTTLNTDQWVK